MSETIQEVTLEVAFLRDKLKNLTEAYASLEQDYQILVEEYNHLREKYKKAASE
jgi:FtsZ-binding cell division protein ZapB